MRVVRRFRDLDLHLERPAVTIGNFDGVHLGHQEVMSRTADAARRRGAKSVVCTFDPHTMAVLSDNPPALLQTTEQRIAAIEAVGIDLAVVIPFDRQIASIGRKRFVDEFLLGELDVGSLHVSVGFSFGHERAGRAAYLERRAEDAGFSVERVAPVVVDGEPASSTRVRELIGEGKLEAAATLLGRPYALAGEVVSGKGRGRLLAAPTANLALGNACTPRRGVYVAEVTLDGETHQAVANVGSRPTFEADGDLVAEAHLLDFIEPIYGRTIELALLRMLREEREFPDGAALAAQIQHDVQATRQYFQTRSAVS
ncbi:MAG TPA: riboflavin biosynthesis protein RibF [Acidobacteriota bacterium]|nr:riboflavin biosynthesis protein RibF [Acidobacteriota bacterium]